MQILGRDYLMQRTRQKASNFPAGYVCVVLTEAQTMVGNSPGMVDSLYALNNHNSNLRVCIFGFEFLTLRLESPVFFRVQIPKRESQSSIPRVRIPGLESLSLNPRFRFLRSNFRVLGSKYLTASPLVHMPWFRHPVSNTRARIS